MTTSLAQQLNALKLSQKDALTTPQRARVSFLFDSKQAANIDDQTLYYICKAGVKQLRDNRVIDLTTFESDILDEKSLSFYRGTETKETLVPIDERVDTLLKVIAPHLLEQPTLKVIEYLLRIYEVHIYHKQTLIQAFIPLFETLYFLRIIQCLNLKDDQTWGWLHQFAYEGVSIDKTTLVKCISRQNGLVFCQIAAFCFLVRGDLHIKFFGVFLTEVLKASSQEGLMFGVLPYISQGLKQSESRDLRISCLLALGQLACRRTLTKEYTAAFVRQILLMITAKDRLEFDEDQKIKGLTTLLFFTQYQLVKFDKKDFAYFQKITKVNKLLELLKKQFDTSTLALVVLESSFENEISQEETQNIIVPLLNLKTVFLLTQSLCNRVYESDAKSSKTRLQLEMIKQIAPEQFQQSIVFILKQVSDSTQKDAILKLLQNGEQGNLLVCYGDKEYSILSALSSHKQITRDAALKSLNDKTFVQVLSKKEAGLVSMVLLQILSSASVDENQFLQIAGALKHVSSLTDTDFEVLLGLFDKICDKKITYSKSTADLCVNLLCGMEIKNVQNQKVQAWLAFQHKIQLQSTNPYIEIVSQKKGKANDPIDYLVSKILESTQQYLPFLLGLFQSRNACIDFLIVAKTLKKLGVAVQKDLLLSTVQNQLLCPILSIMKLSKFKNASEVLTSILDGVSADQICCESRLVNKIIGVSLVQKQYWGQAFDLVQLHKKISADLSKFAEILLNMALTSNSKLKRMFAIQVLVSMHQKGSHQFQLNSQLSYKIMIGAVLVLFNDSDRHIREGAVKLAEVMLETQKQVQKDAALAVIEVFADTEKPSSVQKRPAKLTPMKSKTVTSLLEDLIAAKADLIVDQGQLRLVLSKHQKPEVFEEILRSLLDYPTAELKQKLIQVLTLPQKHAIIFCMNLAQSLQKVFVQIQKHPEQTNGFLLALGALISHLQDTSPQGSKKEIFSSLTLPYLRFITDKPQSEVLILKCFETCVLTTQVLKEIEQRHLVEVFKLYIKSKPQQKLRLLFIQYATIAYKGDDLALCLVEQLDLELVLETIISLAPTQSAKLFQKSIETLQSLVNKFVENSDVAYSIELCSQLAKQCAPNKSDHIAAHLQDILSATKKVWTMTKSLTQQGLKQEQDSRSDPFNEFMADEQKEASDDDQQSDNEIDLLPCLQVFTSLFNLFTPIEQKESLGSIDKTTSILNEIADFLQLVCKTKSAAASVQSGIKSQLYHLYQSLVLRTANRPAEGRPYSSVITKYLSCSVNLIEQGGMAKLLGEGNLVLNTIRGLPDYCTLVCFTLLWLASQSQLDLSEQNHIKVGLDRGAALYLAQETLLWSIDTQQDVSPLRDLLFNVHHVQIYSDKFKVDEQTEQLFGSQAKEFSWTTQCTEVIKGSDVKATRRFLFLVCTILNQWLVKTPQFVSRIAPIAGVDQPTEEVQEQLLHMILSSYLLREQVQVLLQTDSSQSLTRLQTCINSLQSTLNEMMSLQIHIKTVMQILDMVPQTLKSNTLCLLLDKLSTFSSGWLAKCSSNLHAIFEIFVDKCLTLLESSNNTESLIQLLLTVVSRTASPSLPKQMQIRSVETTMKHHRGSLQLQTQTVLTEMNLMETYSFQMLDYFHLYLKHTLDGFAAKDQPFIDTYKHALLKSLVCISQVFLKFLSADQLEQVITLAIIAAAEKVIVARIGDPVEIILESISSEAPQHKKLIMQATMNSYSILLKHAKSGFFETIALRYFQQLLSPVIRRLPQSYISEHHEKFVIFFKQMFSLPQKAEASAPYIVECFNAFTLKLNEETLRPIIVVFTKWAAKEPRRRLILFQVLCGCLETLREFFVPMVKIYFEQAFASLTECQKDLNVSKQGKRTHIGSQPDETLVLLKQVCRLFELNYKHDQTTFLQNDTFETLCDPIADLFDLTTVPAFERFVDDNLKPLILEMDERSNDDSMWQKLNYTLLMKTRSEQWQTRLAVLSVIENLFDKMRERYLVILNDTIPFISELLEDEDERVEQAAKRIVLRIEQLTGESINEYLK